MGGDVVRRGRWPFGLRPVYPTFTRQIRVRDLRPHCEPCSATKGRANAPIEHPAGEETQWGLARAPPTRPPTGVGQERAPARRCARALQQVARHLARPRTRPTYRRPGQDHPQVGWADEEAALDRMTTVPPRLGQGDRHVRRGGQALRHPGRDLPTRRGITARAWSRRPTTAQPNVGGESRSTTSRSQRSPSLIR